MEDPNIKTVSRSVISSQKKKEANLQKIARLIRATKGTEQDKHIQRFLRLEKRYFGINAKSLLPLV